MLRRDEHSGASRRPGGQHATAGVVVALEPFRSTIVLHPAGALSRDQTMNAGEYRREARHFLFLSRQMSRPRDRTAMVEVAALRMERLVQHQRATLKERFRLAQRARRETIAMRARVLEDIVQSRELMAHADFVLTLPYVR